MANEENPINQKEFQALKDKLRKDAYEKELMRLFNINEKKHKTIRMLVIVLVLITSVNLIAWVIYFDPFLPFSMNNVETTIETDSLPPPTANSIHVLDTVSVNPIIYYTVQMGAFRKKTKPDFMNHPNFPVVHYENNSLQCFGFGKFETLDEAKSAICFLNDLGFKNCVIKKIENGQPVETFD